MLELTKSMMRFSWAMSLLGVRQMANLINPSDGWDDAKDAMNAVSSTASEQMGDTVKSFYKAGDRFQSEMLDNMSKFFEGDWSDPGKVIKDAWDTVDHTWSDLRDDLSDDKENDKK